jgi:hypothetical protein
VSKILVVEQSARFLVGKLRHQHGLFTLIERKASLRAFIAGSSFWFFWLKFVLAPASLVFRKIESTS